MGESYMSDSIPGITERLACIIECEGIQYLQSAISKTNTYSNNIID